MILLASLPCLRDSGSPPGCQQVLDLAGCQIGDPVGLQGIGDTLDTSNGQPYMLRCPALGFEVFPKLFDMSDQRLLALLGLIGKAQGPESILFGLKSLQKPHGSLVILR